MIDFYDYAGFPVHTDLYAGAASTVRVERTRSATLFDEKGREQNEAVALSIDDEALEHYERDIWLGGAVLLGLGANLMLLPSLSATHPVLVVIAASTTVITSPKYLRGLWEHMTGQRDSDSDILLGSATVASLFWSQSVSALAFNWLMNVGEYVETLTLRQRGQLLERWFEVSNKKVWLVTDKAQIYQPLANIEPGDRVLLSTFEPILLDGKIEAGQAMVFESPVTGRRMPVMKQAGEHVHAGSLLLLGQLQVMVESVGDQAQRVRLVQKARELPEEVKAEGNRRARKMISTALAASIATFAITVDLPRTLATLMIASPYAFGLAAPSAIQTAINSSVIRGGLIQNRTFFEVGPQLDTIVFDKTGTLTEGTPHVTQVISLVSDYNASEVLQLAAAAEQSSEHPLAKAIMSHVQKQGVVMITARQSERLVGQGVWAEWTDHHVVVGSQRLMNDLSVDVTAASARLETYRKPQKAGATVVYVAHQRQLIGLIEVQDKIREEARAALQALQATGLRLMLLTGDSEEAAKAVSQAVGIDAWRANLNAEQKADLIGNLQAKGQRVALVSSQISPSPTLSADLGIITGTHSGHRSQTRDETDAAITLASSNLQEVIRTLKLASATDQIIQQNYRLANVLSGGGLVIAALGLINPLAAVVIPHLTSLAVMLNSGRLMLDEPTREPLISTA